VGAICQRSWVIITVAHAPGQFDVEHEVTVTRTSLAGKGPQRCVSTFMLKHMGAALQGHDGLNFFE